MYNNTCSKVSTHFLRGVELIKEFEEDNGVASENWAYPVVSFGDPKDYYYAEIWSDGMDWNRNFFIIETIKLETPKVTYFMLINSSELDKMNKYDFDKMLDAIMWWRRSCLLFDKPDVGYFSDEPWAFLRKDENGKSVGGWVTVVYEHHSQEPVEFYIKGDSIGNNTRSLQE